MKNKASYSIVLAFGEATLLPTLQNYFIDNDNNVQLIFLESLEELSEKSPNVDYQESSDFQKNFSKADAIVYLEELYKHNFSEKVTILELALENQLPIYSFSLKNQEKNQYKLYDFKLADVYSDQFYRKSFSIEKKEIVVITGAGGFIGKGIARRFAEKGSHLILIDYAETALFYLQQEFETFFPSLNVHYFLNDVCDKEKMNKIFEEFRPTTVIHAAAFKHVSLLENKAEAAIKNNIEGTYAVLKLAEKYRVNRFLLISTDKAVKPQSIMGKTKAVAEQLVAYFAAKNTEFLYNSVRFGNVLGSTGSVLPLFEKQLRWKEQLWLTNPEAKRYFYTLDEVCKLIFTALEASENQRVFLLRPIKQLAIHRLASLFLLLKKKPLNFKYIDLKPGEKLEELLFLSEERILQQEKDYLVLQPQLVAKRKLENKLSQLFDNQLSETDKIKVLHCLVE